MSDDPTGAFDPTAPNQPPTAKAPTDMPARICRYRIERVLGQGGFGVVYLAFDEQLQRHVALKTPHASILADGEDINSYLDEARLVASLDHANIVPVYDVGSTPEHPCFIVSKFIEGTTLQTRIRHDRTTVFKTAELVACIAEALHYAHHRGLVHRDIKPGNILIDKSGEPFLVDFGLALKEEDIGTGPRFAGTAAYMSPEQARGEGHRVDARSDVFSLGVVMYEMLTGRRPFKSESKFEPPDQVTDFEPRPPRQYDDRIPRELERICLKAMAKRASDRYSTARDFADDLRHFLDEHNVSQLATMIGSSAVPDASATVIAPSPGSARSVAEPATPPSVTSGVPLRIIPKGLRSFDAHDADFFLELVPGPRDRNGLPDVIRFWKTHIEEPDADRTFAVGLIYGPSGCGKSSLVKAGLLPRLPDRVTVIYVEATADDTEAKLLQGLRKPCPALPADLDLKQTLAAVRRGQGILTGQKVLVVLDQFEQWLHARREQQNTELVQALRQCDGSRLQCILMVRDDFWMGATRFLRELEVRLVEGQNSAAVDLFPIRHAEKVLAAFGQAFGVLPENLREKSQDQKQFVQQAVQGLAQEGKVTCVRLALFAEIMKNRAWSPAALREVGGTQGVGETFLEETFSASTAPPLHRYHQQAARAVLRALLPDSGADIKGYRRSAVELQEACGYAGQPEEFAELIRILDGEIRLITPTDPANAAARSAPAQHYQLTHDYLVPSVRDWLTRKQKETRRGRAELLLADRASVWNARPENRQLPSLWQWASIHVLARKSAWTESQRMMMRQADRFYSIRSAIVIIVLSLAGWVVYEGNGRLQAQMLHDRLLDADTTEAAEIIQQMPPYRRWVEPRLRVALVEAGANKDARKRLHASLALHALGVDQGAYLFDRLVLADPHEFSVIRDTLANRKDDLPGPLWWMLDPADKRYDEDQKFRIACALASYDPNSAEWGKIAPQVATKLVTHHPFVIARWTEALRPVAGHLMPALADLLEDEKRSDAERGLIAKVYGNYSSAVPGALVRLEARLAEQPASDGAAIALIRKQACVAAALLAMGRTERVWPVLAQRADPTLRSLLLERVAATGVDPRVLTDRLDHEPDASILRALLLSLGDYGPGILAVAQRQVLAPRIEKLYRDHPDAGVHGAADWLLRQWQETDRVKALDTDLASGQPDEKRKWFVNKKRLTMVIVESPGQIWLREGDQKHRCRVERRFAIAAKEVTHGQYLASQPKLVPDLKEKPPPDCPMAGITWYEAARYCNWLSAADGLPADEWCFVPNDQGEYADGMKLAPNWWKRTGYRLPTEAEWVHACRAGADTPFAFGNSADVINSYAWNAGNSLGRSHPVGTRKPNDLGLFDMHGNVWEWTQDLVVLSKKALKPEIKLVRDDIDERYAVSTEDYRLQLGGSWGNQPADVRHTFHSWNKAYQRHPAVGFRPARTVR